MFRVEISKQDGQLQERKGEKKDGSGPYHMRWQTAYLHNGGPYPEKFDLPLGRDRPAYPAGTYTPAPASVVVEDHRLRFAYEMVLLAEVPAK